MVTKIEDKTQNKEIEAMIEAGVAFGHSASKLHPKMKTYITKVKDGVQLIDLEQTIQKMDEAMEFVSNSKKEGKTFLFVGTSPSVRSIVREAAESVGAFYVVDRWIGGALTNFSEIKKRLKYFNGLEEKINDVNFSKNYTKKERIGINKDLERLKLKFGGIKKMEKVPDVVFIVDISKDDIALKEAIETKRAIIAITDTNVNPTGINYIVPGNDDAVSSVSYIINKIIKALK